MSVAVSKLCCTHPPSFFVKSGTRLATANRSRVTIRGRPCKIFLTSSLITMQNLVVVSHTVRAHVGGPKNLGRWGSAPLGCGRISDALGTPFSTTFVTAPNHVSLGQTTRAYINGDPPERVDPSASAFQGHSRTRELTRFDWLLVIHSNHGPISYRFTDKRRFRSKSAVFPPRVFNAPGEGVPLGIL